MIIALGNTFLPFDYQYTLMDKIRSRTQGLHGTVLGYVAIMECLFRRFRKYAEEQEQVNYIRRNLLPYLQVGLGVQHFDTLDLTPGDHS